MAANPVFTRRSVMLGLTLMSATRLDAAPGDPSRRLAELEQISGGRLGVVILDPRGRRLATHRADERFLLCSTFKAFLAGAVLARVDRGAERLDRAVPVTAADVVAHSPAVTAAVPAGSMTIEQLCASTVMLGDNAAANLLLDTIGGPAGMTRAFRRLGGDAARLDRRKTELNRRDGVKDTTTPAAAAAMLRRQLVEGSLTGASRQRLEGWMIETGTGRRRLRAGLPAGWVAGDKTGSGPGGEFNDIAFVDVPGRGRCIIAAYYEAPARPTADPETVLAQVGGIL